MIFANYTSAKTNMAPFRPRCVELSRWHFLHAGDGIARSAGATGTSPTGLYRSAERFTRENRNVSANSGRGYAPSEFVGEDEAKKANLRKADFKDAMRQLFQDAKDLERAVYQLARIRTIASPRKLKRDVAGPLRDPRVIVNGGMRVRDPPIPYRGSRDHRRGYGTGDPAPITRLIPRRSRSTNRGIKQ